MKKIPPNNVQIAIFHDEGKTFGRAGAKERGFVMYLVDIGTEGVAMHLKLCDIFVV